jgi:uncharacterized membrane protein
VSTKAHAQPRLGFVDTMRGLAVVFMVPLHASHGWLHPEVRAGLGWALVQFFGGLAAPLFLSLAGVSLGLRWAERARTETVPDHLADLGRALSMVVLGYLLRLQMWVIDGAGYAHPKSYPAELLLLSGYVLAYFALVNLHVAPRRVLTLCAVAAVLISGGFVATAQVAPARLLGLARVDVLQCIGGSLALVIGVGALRGSRFAEPSLLVALGVGAAFFASWTRSWVPGALPEPLAAYLGQWPAAPGRSVMGLFPLFPWCGYTFIGAAIGVWWGRLAHTGTLRRVVFGTAAACALLALSTAESFPHVFRTFAEWPWLVQPGRVFYRLNIVMALAGIALLLSSERSPVRGALQSMGRASLLIYWVHLEFTFGIASAPFAKALRFDEFALGSAVLLLAMLALSYVRFRVPRRPGARR